MKTITVNSKAHGVKQILVDDEDYDDLIQYNWSITKSKHTFYACRQLKKGEVYSTISMHRHILRLTDAEIFGEHADHNGLNNQRSNLRRATVSQNNRNRKSNKSSTSIYVGVSYESARKKWRSSINLNGKEYFLGRFDTAEEAAAVRDAKATELFSDFANLNFNNEN